VVSVVVLFWFWLLLVGEWDREELVAAAIAAVVAAALAAAAQQAAGLTPTIGRRALARAASVPLDVFVDFGIVVWALVRSVARGRAVRGSFHVRRPAPEDPAWAMWLATISPNAYVVDIDTAADTVLVHDLVTRRASEEPAA